MAIFAVPLETQVRKPSDATLRAKDSAAFIHEAEDLVVFSPRLYKSEFIQALVDLHSAIFGLSPAQALESAELRVKAADTVDQITGQKSTDVQADWARLEEYLRQCYVSIQRQLAI